MNVVRGCGNLWPTTSDWHTNRWCHKEKWFPYHHHYHYHSRSNPLEYCVLLRFSVSFALDLGHGAVPIYCDLKVQTVGVRDGGCRTVIATDSTWLRCILKVKQKVVIEDLVCCIGIEKRIEPTTDLDYISAGTELIEQFWLKLLFVFYSELMRFVFWRPCTHSPLTPHPHPLLATVLLD